MTRGLEQCLELAARSGCVASGLSGFAGTEQTIETIRTGFHRRLVFGERLCGSSAFQQYVGQHFARRTWAPVEFAA